MRKISQIDVVPTIANILDISIPYSNLGMYLPEFTLKNNDEVINLKYISHTIKQFKGILKEL